MLSWNEAKDVVDRFYDWFTKNSDIKVWKDDQDGISDHLNDDIARGIEESRLVVAFVSDGYFASRHCQMELNYAYTLAKDIIIVKLRNELELLGRGAISLIASDKLYVRAEMFR